MTPTPEQVAQWAREAGWPVVLNDPDGVDAEWIETATRFAIQAMAEQAEADAKLCDSLEFEFRPGVNCAAAIRANAPKVTT